ncbi:16S rRNA (cytosine(1402)-N(4))-methyltransferase RsmH [Jonesia denitrificans]|uniref:Ribosomal RNA small subunit methyltransferase H n=1 Tax=Jonesia denitrificans (strain ATCC 14870 / DSM 20603 / BCRC 15368 / CIP 55.134 / JCM 11481 / NBRC 15587 / NCTC 10816 / Prevot 55134) TaxID=471856 RepID=C7R3I6_JONDD|nr:16S rRNA (cytosine(1402)-N(4))-methyltransferase RsmH [Jonesia denitrificans]ACV08722.1 S-adenosyl-methyltransferase MraW [Jonesia denitrificans DSM 20603]AVJ53337.1 16S rRNA (cytosine(1402)-N(4))-methyltransferase RsmH [Jonesia denitrificans]QXB42286.1 16S rRNA (cytosine(1402)-N(4))-methyltransferase RsmH [Jonesia denitrificans]SQH20710.1 Ribosomal RNA small subunit methyltransferase H [Jonesia denitrificans]
MNEFQDESPASRRHIPVLRDRCLELMAPALNSPQALYVDATLGMGGHTRAVLEAFPNVIAIGIDRDAQALALASERLESFGQRFRAVHTTYDNIYRVIHEAGFDGAQAILMDLGVSSLQIDERERGFAYAHDAPLDMRMDSSAPLTAADILNTYDEKRLATILKTYGEERFAPRIARAIVRRREERPWERSGELVDLIRESIPAAARATGGNPAKRTFQALRIEVNEELDVLAHALPAAIESLVIGGRLLVESYHSLEDRMTKVEFTRGLQSSAPPDLPIEPETHRPYLRALTRGAEKADENELQSNPRSASVRLRAIERVRPTPAHLRNGEYT